MLTIRRITRMDSPWFAAVDALYESAFPWHERREPLSKTCALQHSDYSLQAWFDGEQFVGMIGAWHFTGYTYIEHLAVNDQLRSQGYGKQMLTQFLSLHPFTILEIDPLTTEIAHRRLRFYQSLGFRENAYCHHHPSYHAATPPHELMILSYPQPVSDTLYQRFSNDLQSVVMAFEKEFQMR